MSKDSLLTDLLYYKYKQRGNDIDKQQKLVLFSARDNIEQFVPVPPENGTGGFRIFRLLENLGIIITNHKSGSSPVTVRADTMSVNFKFTFNLSPKPVSVTIKKNRVKHIAAKGNTYILSPNVAFDLLIPPHNHQKWLSIVIDPELLCHIIESFRESLTKEFLNTVENPDHYFYFNECKFTPCIELVIEQVLDCPYNGSLKRLFLEGKAIELIALRFDLLLGNTKNRFHPFALTKTDVEKLHYIRSILKNRIINPPTLSELSNLVGLNINKLKNGYKFLFGTSIGKNILNLRMEKARYLLEHGGLNVSEASSAVGYKSISHFSRAFKKLYGFYPHILVKMKNHTAR